MKWGVRRYRDKNGRLTEAGKAHYYNDGVLNRKGHQLNRTLAKEYTKYEKQIHDSVKKNPQYNDQLKKLKAAQVDSRSSRIIDQENWAQGKDFKGLDYYQFKDAAADRWAQTTYGKQYYSSLGELRKMVEKEVGSHKDSSKLLKHLPYNDSMLSFSEEHYRTIEYGREATNRILNRIQYFD